MTTTMKKATIIKKQIEEFGINTVYLFGSRARGDIGPLSDYDIGILLNEKINPKKYFDIQLELISLFSSIYKTNKIDLVIMNNAPVILNMNIIKEGKITFEKDKKYRVAFETYIMNTYFDRLPYEERHAEKLIESLLKN